MSPGYNVRSISGAPQIAAAPCRTVGGRIGRPGTLDGFFTDSPVLGAHGGKVHSNRRHDATPLQAGRVHPAFIGRPPGATMPHDCNGNC